MSFPAEFFGLNYSFAQKAASVSAVPLADALRKYTHIYLSFNLDRDFSPANPIWRAYLKGLPGVADPVDWTYEFYLQRMKVAPKLPPALEFGCFSFAEWAGGRIRIHFRYNDPLGAGPLSLERINARQGELKAMFRYIRQHVAAPITVVGGSWLYAIEAYRRLFPLAFLTNATDREVEPQFLVQWGQFLDHHNQVKPDLARRFLENLELQTSLEGVLACFPYPVLHLECPIGEFYTFFMI
jgi:hypothetical protein